MKKAHVVIVASFLCVAADGQAVNPIVSEWETGGRAKTLQWFRSEFFGRAPECPKDEVFSPDGVSFAGGQVKIRIHSALPKEASASHPAPVFVLLDHYHGAERKDGLWHRPDTPTNTITGRGYAYVNINLNDVALNCYDERWSNRVHRIYGVGKPDDWGTISAWAWGVSRVVDWIERQPALDATRIAVVGHSRGGKAALWAGAQDLRIAMVVPNGSGTGGARLMGMNLPDAEPLDWMLDHAIRFWFCPNMMKYRGCERTLPYDADDLLRLVCPRLVYVGSGSEDAWAGPRGEFEAARRASDLWRAYGLKGLAVETFPKPGEWSHEGEIGYHLHKGPHDLKPWDWDRFLDFADRHLKRGRALELTELSVVVPMSRLASEETAEKELVEYVQKVTGVRLLVVSEKDAGGRPAIHLGPTAFARKSVSGLASFGDEEWTVRVVSGNLVIAGGRPRGTLYGVYHFLEDVLGVRWLTQCCEYVPAKPRVTLADGLCLRSKPAMPYRSIDHVLGDSAPAFLARNRMNVYGSAYGGGKTFGGAYHCHTLYLNLGTPDEVRALYKAHPDWFPLIDGRRYCHVELANHAAQSQLCLTNPDLRRYWTEKMRERIRADRAKARVEGVPDPMYYAIDQNDAYDGFCMCPSCAAILRREESRSGLLLDFVNYVAAELEAEAPNSLFQMMALHSTEKPPKFLKARKNVTIRLCDTTSNEIVPWMNPENAPHYDNLRAWGAHADSISMWDYQINYGSETSTCLPTPNERTFAADLRTLRDCKGDGVVFEHERAVTGDLRDLKVWLEFKLVENPDLDDKTLIRTFTDLYYGPEAGAAIRAWRERLGQAADAVRARASWYPSISSYSFITADVLRESLRLREEALAAVKGDPERTARVEHAFMSLDRYCLARAGALKRMMRNVDPSFVLPDTATLVARTRAIYDRETKARKMVRENNGRELPRLEKFLAAIGNMRDLPVPEKFKSVDRDALFLIPATFARPWYQGVVFVDDAESPAGRALTLNMQLVKANPHKEFPKEIYDWPLRSDIRTTKGHEKTCLHELPAAQPKGYHWYKLGDDLMLSLDASLILWRGATLPLDGVVSDNSELGQKYDVYVSVKITGPDVFTTGKVTDDTVYFFDQVAIVRKTVNR